MNLSIIIVNYKTPALLLDCLASVYKYECAGVEIIVVDNDSQDNTLKLLQENYPEVIFFQMGYNSGFARANNAGIKMARSQVVLLLNSDTINVNDAINNCYKKLENSSFIVAGVQLLNADGSPQISGNFAMKGGLNYLLPLPFTGKFLKWIADFFKIQKPNVPNAHGTVEVDWINGAFLMVKMKAIKRAGLLDEDFFLYAEEAEWCGRLKKIGKLCIYGDDHVIHLQGESSATFFNSQGKGYYNLFDKRGLQIMLSNFVRMRKQFGIFWVIFNLVFYCITVPVFLIGIIISGLLKRKHDRYSILQWKGFTKNVVKLVGYAPKILMNKPYFYKVL